jgi:hypothetical protein
MPVAAIPQHLSWLNLQHLIVRAGPSLPSSVSERRCRDGHGSSSSIIVHTFTLHPHFQIIVNKLPRVASTFREVSFNRSKSGSSRWCHWWTDVIRNILMKTSLELMDYLALLSTTTCVPREQLSASLSIAGEPGMRNMSTALFGM